MFEIRKNNEELRFRDQSTQLSQGGFLIAGQACVRVVSMMVLLMLMLLLLVGVSCAPMIINYDRADLHVAWMLTKLT